jgi:hypothetical protein
MVLAIGLSVYSLELACRRPTNLKGLQHGMKFRKRTRCHMPHDTPEYLAIIDPDDNEGPVYPLSTNLLVTPVGGTATALHFSFQLYTIFWAFFLAASWTYWAQKYGYDMLRIGTLNAHTPQQLCSVVKWGANRQKELMQDQFTFCLWAWFFQFVSSIVLALYQQMRFHKLDDDTTMKDFACYVRGLPRLKGDEDVEGLFKDFLEKETGQKIVGVSVAWDISTKVYDEVMEALELEGIALEKAHELLKNGGKEAEAVEEEEPVLPHGVLTKAFSKVDKAFGFGLAASGDAPSEVDVERVREILEGLKTSDVGFVVFATEGARDAAVALSKVQSGFTYEEKHTVRLETKSCEPGTVRWDGISYGSRTRHRNTRMVMGALFVLASLVGWGVIFYLPYAYYVTSFTYANGSEPSFFANTSFSLLVTAGNQVMYLVCDLVTIWADFAFEDEREFWYNVYYVVACVLNVFVDLIVTGNLAYREMVGMGVHTADGRLLETVNRFQEVVESYPMQKSMGDQLFAYAFPSTYLTPFVLEPFLTVIVPMYFCKWLLRSHGECTKRDAELSMQFFMPMNLGRYSDLLLNMCLGVLILFLPGGYVLPMFLSMGLSHIFIYLYDHWRVLRAVPDYCFSRSTVDNFGTGWLSLPTALTASCCVFKGYHHYWEDLHDWRLLCVMLWAFGISLGLHLLILKQIYKRKMAHSFSEMTYAELAKWEPKTWFSVNPVHCLRSKYIWAHEPAQVFYQPGKAHLQRINEEIGSFFENKEAQKPDPPSKKAQDALTVCEGVPSANHVASLRSLH